MSHFIFQFFNALLSTLYIRIKEPIPNSITCINKECFSNIYEYLKIGVPASLVTAVESLGLQGLSIVAILIGDDTYFGHIVIFGIFSVVNCILQGFESATVVTVSTGIGEKSLEKMKMYRNCSIGLGFTIQLVLVLLLFLLSDVILNLFVNDKEKIELFRSSYYIMCITVPLDIFQYLINAFGRCCGKLWQNTLICICIFTCFMLLLSYVIAYLANMGLVGIWLSFLISIVALLCTFSICVSFYDYENIIDEMNSTALGHDKVD